MSSNKESDLNGRGLTDAEIVACLRQVSEKFPGPIASWMLGAARRIELRAEEIRALREELRLKA